LVDAEARQQPAVQRLLDRDHADRVAGEHLGGGGAGRAGGHGGERVGVALQVQPVLHEVERERVLGQGAVDQPGEERVSQDRR
jgi:hypothetical protein